MFRGSHRTNEVWFICILKTFRSQSNFYFSEFVMNTMKVLADEYQGKVRFGYIDTYIDEALKETFDVGNVPSNFLIKDGTVYEMQAMSLGYKPIREFIEGEYKN